jgi:hypothetical protein
MIFNLYGRQYSSLFGSDLEGDGVFLELNDVTSGRHETVIEVFRSDLDGNISFNCLKNNLPFELVEKFVLEARNEFPKASAK